MSSEIRLSPIKDMELLEILEELQNSNDIISSDSSYVIPDKRLKSYFCSDTLQFTWQGFFVKLKLNLKFKLKLK